MSHISKNLKFIDCVFRSNKAMAIMISVELHHNLRFYVHKLKIKKVITGGWHKFDKVPVYG